MKKIVLISLIASIVILPAAAFAISDPVVDPMPDTVDADSYTLTIHVDPGSKVKVLGGPAYIPPMTDGAGADAMDGVVEVTVGLTQEAENVFSITASKNAIFSDSITVTINEEPEDTGGIPLPGDRTPPDTPVINTVDNPIAATFYIITGSTETNAKINVEKSDGSLKKSVNADGRGLFSVKVSLVSGRSNRFNIYAEDSAGNKSGTVQVIIQATTPVGEEEVMTDEPDTEDVVEEEVASEPESEGEVVTAPVKAQMGHTYRFTDINGHWAEDYIGEMYERGFASGKSETQFDPNANITRAELIKIAVNAFGIHIKEGYDASFEDVPDSAWFEPYVAAAEDEGIVGGFEDGTFRPNKPITRAAALKILIEASGLPMLGGNVTTFTDVQPNAWFAQYVNFAFLNKIVGGYPDNSFRPGASITRAEVAKIVMKILEITEE